MCQMLHRAGANSRRRGNVSSPKQPVRLRTPPLVLCPPRPAVPALDALCRCRLLTSALSLPTRPPGPPLVPARVPVVQAEQCASAKARWRLSAAAHRKLQATFLTKLCAYVSLRRVCFLHSMLMSIKTPRTPRKPPHDSLGSRR